MYHIIIYNKIQFITKLFNINSKIYIKKIYIINLEYLSITVYILRDIHVKESEFD